MGTTLVKLSHVSSIVHCYMAVFSNNDEWIKRKLIWRSSNNNSTQTFHYYYTTDNDRQGSWIALNFIPFNFSEFKSCVFRCYIAIYTHRHVGEFHEISFILNIFGRKPLFTMLFDECKLCSHSGFSRVAKSFFITCISCAHNIFRFFNRISFIQLRENKYQKHLCLLDPQMYEFSQVYKTSLKCINTKHNCINHPQMYKNLPHLYKQPTSNV